MNIQVSRLTSFIVIFSLFWACKQAFTDTHQQDRQYYSQALHQVYALLGSRHNLSIDETTYNSRFCFQQDYFKLTHPDIVKEDIYCQRNQNDAILKSYKKDCFSTHNQAGNALKNAYNSLSIYHGWPVMANRKAFMTTRCIFQTSIALQIGLEIAMKSMAQIGLSRYEQFLKSNNASQACLRDMDFYPKSYSLNNKNQCQDILEIFQQKYDHNNVSQEYILKSNVHLGQGLTLLSRPLNSKLQGIFANGSECGKKGKGNNTIVQELINNPVLLKGRKIDFRIWFFVVQSDPLIMYIYDYTGIMTCFDVYDKDHLTQYNFNCNSGVARDYYDKNKKGAKDPIGLQEIHQGWTYKQWGQVLIGQGLVTSEQWWKDEFLPQIETLITYYMRILMKKPKSDQRLSGLYAFDATINRDLKVKLYDFNTGPNYLAITPGNIKVQKMLHKDTFKLLQLYMRQRYTALKTFINEHMLPQLKQMKGVNKETLDKVLRVKALPQKNLFQWYLIDQQKAVQNCKLYDPSL